MKKLYLLLVILLTFSSSASNSLAQDNLPPVEYGTNPYTYNYGQIKGDDPYQAVPSQNQGYVPQRYQQPPQVQQQYNQPPQATTSTPLVQPEQANDAAPVQQPAQVIDPADPAFSKYSEQDKLNLLLKAKHKFALIVPLTGENADIGKALRDAAMLAMNEKGSEDYALIPIDSNGAGGAETAAELAVTYGAEVILGPVFSDQVKKVAKVARRNKIKVLSFSNNKAIAGNGVYIFGLLPEQQVERMLLFANTKGIKNFSAIVPNNVFGHQVGDQVRKYAAWLGGKLMEVGLYSAKTPKSTAAKVVADSYTSKGIKPSLSKDGIIIPEGGEKLKSIAAALSKAGVGCGRIRCLGVASWDDRDIVSSGALNGAWYAASPYEDVEDFLIRFQKKYKYSPDEISALGYDAAALAIEVSPNFNRETLEKRSGYKGIKGIYRLTPEGINQRGYAVYEIHNGSAKVLDGSPGRF